jgi:hypothetical protein
MISNVVFEDIFSYNCEGFSLPSKVLSRDKRLNAIALLQHGLNTREVSKLLGIVKVEISTMF